VSARFTAVDLFAGPGGWDVAARNLGIGTLGIEIDKAACATRRAAGLPTVEADVLNLDPLDFPADMLIASPPCQTFSMAGNGSGRRALDDVLLGVKELSQRQPLTVVHDDERTGLVLEPLRWALEAIDAGRPYRWIALEQVPTVLPVWEAVDAVLEAEGYSSLYGYVHSEQYGVPQTRKRAVLLARLDGPVTWPEPTHSRYHSRSPQRLDEGVQKWVSMAEALGWGMTQRPSMTVCGGGTDTGGAEPFGNAARQGIERERQAGRWVLSTGVNSATVGLGSERDQAMAEGRWRDIHKAQERPLDRPAPTVDGKAPGTWAVHPEGERQEALDSLREQREPRWMRSNYSGHSSSGGLTAEERGRSIRPLDNPSLAITGKPGHWLSHDDATAPLDNRAQRISVQEAAALQTFPVDYPWQGTKGKQYQQVGNAVPPKLAEAILATLTGSVVA
jgi:DNA (cytosine-5)-methyltransferase 1